MNKNTNDIASINNRAGRRVGFEIEYAGITLHDAAKIIQSQFGGTLHHEHSAVTIVHDTKYGDFTLELDAIPLQKLAKSNKRLEQKKHNDNHHDAIDIIQHYVQDAIGNVGARIAPYEIVTPPWPVDEIHTFQFLCDALREAGAKGTKSSLYYAFGLHLNPEVATTNVEYIVRHLQSFLLINPWLQQKHAIDISRRVTSFIDPFPKKYMTYILRSDYQPNIEQFIIDYHQYNPTRNRALDMLPLMAYVDEALTRSLYGQEEKINPRPTFHYRLPNSEIAQSNWAISDEWKRWRMVEHVAGNNILFNSLLEGWHNHHTKFLSNTSSWMKYISKRLDKINVS